MNLRETNALLAYCSVFDHRTLSDEQTNGWHNILIDQDVTTCRAAVDWHYAHETRWIMPADIRVYARRYGPRPTAITSSPAVFNRTPEQQAEVATRVQQLRHTLRDLFKKDESDEPV